MDRSKEPPESEPDRPRVSLGTFLAELRRRKVIRVALAYAVVAWVIIQVASTLFQGFEVPAWAFRLIVILLVLGFPLALVFTWAFELTPDGIKPTGAAREEAADSEDAGSFQGRRNWLALGIGAAIPTIVFGALTLYFFLGKPAGDHGTAIPAASGAAAGVSLAKSVAVLPFENRSDREEDAYFTDGIHDDLLTQISRIRDLRTISRTSVMAYRGTKKNARDIGRELAVAAILEGGVQRAGDQVRINVQLVDAATDNHLWGNTYTRKLSAENIFEIQSEIAGSVAAALQAVLLPEEKAELQALPTRNLPALEAFFRAKESFFTGTFAGSAAAVRHLEEAIALDPGFALAHARLGQALLFQASLGLDPAANLLARAEEHILEAIDLDARSSEGYNALGVLRNLRGDNGGAERAFQRAIELNPNNAYAYARYGDLLAYSIGDASRAAEAFRKSFDLDPNSEAAQENLMNSLRVAGRADEALELAKSIVARHPQSAMARHGLGELYEDYLNRRDLAIVAYRQALVLEEQQPPWMLERLGFAYLGLGDPEEARRWFEHTLRVADEPGYRDWLTTYMLKATGEVAEARRAALAALERNSTLDVAHWVLQDIDLASGHPERSRARYAAAYPQFFDPDVTIKPPQVYLAKDIARVLLATGETAQAENLLRKAIRTVESTFSNQNTGAQEVQLWAVAGNEEKTLAAVRKYLETVGSPYFLYLQAELEPYLKKPRFAVLLEAAEAKMAAQLAHVRELEARGELAPVPSVLHGRAATPVAAEAARSRT